ncbi:unknown [Choristoneura fumiferana multiple nucleopolyhedrovirus]|uniref:Uncharacterized protein n=1 Tax=Choristoneura fumiferana nuclear polyhedrosis virus TaxID=208973 RepID=Q7TLN1_NPVCF|nr:unknown [Choristoneura fumiferana multiple nucleopolyhedrovirus]AAP29903.1 unknown [Choristoneura fumiferana multiple nucleopolyhedrovirus]
MCWDNATNLNVCKTIYLETDDQLVANSIKSVYSKSGEGTKIVSGDGQVYRKFSDVPFIQEPARC